MRKLTTARVAGTVRPRGESQCGDLLKIVATIIRKSKDQRKPFEEQGEVGSLNRWIVVSVCVSDKSP
jgi:hypothetical protein